MAAKNRALNVENARIWYSMGQGEMSGGNTEAAVEFFRNAATNDHNNPQYALVLSTSLAAAGRVDEARQALLRLRTAAPENGEINLNLARLAAKEGATPEAVRYYHNALFGTWPAVGMPSRRTAVREELVRFLLKEGEQSRALSELLILSSDIPDNVASHVNIGVLFHEAGDPGKALEQYRRALQLDPTSAEALAGAGKASFALADYAGAQRYLDAASTSGNNSSQLAELRATTQFVISRDPLARGLSARQRARRLSEDLDFVQGELESCLNQVAPDQSDLAVLQPLLEELNNAKEAELNPANLKSDVDGFRVGLNLIYRIAASTSELCHVSNGMHRALLLIAQKHGVTE
jgi:tetratricopeptide (TPR) repeat protein